MEYKIYKKRDKLMSKLNPCKKILEHERWCYCCYLKPREGMSSTGVICINDYNKKQLEMNLKPK
jgi:hypothetical protein